MWGRDKKCGSQGLTLCRQFFPSAFTQVLWTELRSPDAQGKCLYLLSHLPPTPIMFETRSHVSRADLKLAVQLRVALNSWCSCLQLLVL